MFCWWKFRDFFPFFQKKKNCQFLKDSISVYTFPFILHVSLLKNLFKSNFTLSILYFLYLPARVCSYRSYSVLSYHHHKFISEFICFCFYLPTYLKSLNIYLIRYVFLCINSCLATNLIKIERKRPLLMPIFKVGSPSPFRRLA